MVEISGRDLPFDEAITFFRRKLRLPTRTWTDLWEGMHARAFVVAGAMKDELLADFQDSLTKALENGTTLADFRKEFDRIVATHGWSHKGSRGWRSRVIFETNLRTSYLAGRWEQIQQNAERRPFLRYVAVLDTRTRPDHRAWHGTVLAIDDPWWQTHYPPNGWNCRCTVQQLSQRDLDRFDFEQSSRAPRSPLVNKTVNTPEGAVSVQVPEGIDPGWAHNVGEAAFGRDRQSLALEAHGGFERMLAPGGSRPSAPGRLVPEATETRLGPRATDEAGMRARFNAAVGEIDRVMVDPTGGRVAIGEALINHQIARNDGREIYWPFIPELVEDPHEIWVGFVRHPESGRFSVRRRYIKMIDAGADRPIALVSDADKGLWSALTFFPARNRDLRNVRWGLRIYRKGE